MNGYGLAMRLSFALRPLLTLVLVLIVALTSAHTAVGRAEAKGAIGVLICADGATVTILLDASGKPVAKRHGCPDCVLGGLGLAGGVVQAMAPVLARRRAARPARGRHAAPRAVPALLARGPPVAV